MKQTGFSFSPWSAGNEPTAVCSAPRSAGLASTEPAALVAALHGWVRRTARHLVLRHRLQRQIRAFRELDAHTLRDIGVARGEIESIAAEAVGLAEPTRRRIEMRS